MTSRGESVYATSMSGKSNNICLVDAPPLLVRAFRDEGYNVLALAASPEPFVDLPAVLAERDFVPDMVLQVERLAERSLLIGLDSLDCPLLFWAIDPHLNAYWQCVYGRLFDVVCSTQKAWIPRLAEEGAPDVRWLPWFGQDRPFAPWEEREHGLTFVGRVTDHRPARKRMVEFLREKGAACNPAILDSVPFDKMLDLYSRSKIIPNESIFGEVNFRLFEGASCGCLVVGQDIEEQAELFEPGKEMDTYAHMVDFDDRLAACLANDKLVRTMARAAHARVQAEHLPVHRARRIVEYANSAARNRAGSREGAEIIARTAGALWETRRLDAELQAVLDRLGGVPQTPGVMATALRIQAATGADSLLEKNVAALLTWPDNHEPELALTASMGALRLDRFDWARLFWFRYLEGQGKKPASPKSPAELYSLWGADLRRRGVYMRSGAPFDPAVNLPGSAAECLTMILEDDPGHAPTLRALDGVLAKVRGTEQTRVGYLSMLTLRERDDWRLALEIGLAGLASFRLESGLEELAVARELAVKAGQEPSFLRVLKGRDPSGRIAARLGIVPA